MKIDRSLCRLGWAALLLSLATTAGCGGDVTTDRPGGHLEADNSTTPYWCGFLYGGQMLTQGQSIASCDARLRLTMQPDGNLVLYYSAAHAIPLWASGTNGRGGTYVAMQGDGNLVIYTPSHAAVWSTNTWGNSGAYIALQNDGNLVLYTATGSPRWSSHTYGLPSLPTSCGTLDAGQGLGPGDSLASCDGAFHLDMQGDGNLVLYETGAGALWSSRTNGTAARYAVMQGDGNLVVYPTGGGRALWAAGTYNHGGSHVAVQGDGNLVIYSPGGTPLWASNTCCRGSNGMAIWPNGASAANSDDWIANNHWSIQQMRPKVLVLNFVDAPSSANLPTLVSQIAQGLDAGSRYHGYSDGSAPAFLDYQIVRIVDVTDDGYPPVGWNHLNSSYYPLKCKSGDWYQFNYSAVLGSRFAPFIGIADPQNPSAFLTLTQLVQRGMVNEVWLAVDGDPDPYTCSNGVHMNDFQLPEVLEDKQKYDQWDQPIGGSFDPCAGNGCYDADDQSAARAVGRSLRFLYINVTRGPGAALHSLGHGIESNGRAGGPLPYFSANFLPFANFDLDKRFGAPFRDWYGACGNLSSCISFWDDNDLSWVDTGGQRGTMSPFNQGCGSVHFPPNARANYDDQNSFGVLSTCEHYGLHDGPGGTDAQEIYTNAKSHRYDGLEPDGEGGWQVYWRQSFPGLNNAAWDTSGGGMKNWWPYLFY